MSNTVLSILSILMPVITALISGLLSYVLSVKKAKKELEELKMAHSHELEIIEKQHKNDVEKLHLQHEHEREMKKMENEIRVLEAIAKSDLLKDIMDQSVKEEVNSDMGGSQNGD